MKIIDSIPELEAVYGKPLERAIWKEIDHINDHYRQFIEKSPFLIIATHGEKGIDCSPRGDPAGFVRVLDSQYLLIPDRRGNNRIDTLRNIIVNNKVGIIFLVPGVGEAIRISGTAKIILDDDLCQSFSIDGKPASSVLSIKVEKAYFQCQKAIGRSKLWESSSHIQRTELPTAGEMSKVFTNAKNVEFDHEKYDREYPEYMKKTIY